MKRKENYAETRFVKPRIFKGSNSVLISYGSIIE